MARSSSANKFITRVDFILRMICVWVFHEDRDQVEDACGSHDCHDPYIPNNHIFTIDLNDVLIDVVS